MRILGIDPGYAILGYGIVDMRAGRFALVECGAVTTEAGTEMPARLKYIYAQLMELIARFEPEVAAVEELFFNSNAKTAIKVGEARGAAILACANSGLPIYEYTPLQIKQAIVGYGRAEKE
ncbi:MAG: crossover junction endodeoxyribonuclease RuvC, partial [Clostridiales Family XIII bacterium]|nr:crossover junction endodeoxyribonuclease RuvC [Clostridiales Family XIII bacterium]